MYDLHSNTLMYIRERNRKKIRYKQKFEEKERNFLIIKINVLENKRRYGRYAIWLFGNLLKKSTRVEI